MVEKEWLKNKTNVEELEIKYLKKDKRLGPEPVVFGFIHDDWLRLKRQLQEGDELWEFCSPPESWDNLYGREGICIVRNGEIIDRIIMKMN